MVDRYDMSIVLPRFREPRAVIERTIADLSQLSAQLRMEIIVVNDAGDAADLADLERQLPSVRVLYNERNRGKGFSVRRGVLAASGRYVFFTDVDLPVRVRDIRAGFERARSEDIAVLVGRRVRSAASPEGNANRKVTSWLFVRLFRAILRVPVSDPQCPFKLFERNAARRLFGRIRIERYAFDSEIVFKAKRADLAIREIGIEWLDLREAWSLPQTLRVFSKMSWDLLQIRASWSFVPVEALTEHE